MRWKHRGEMIAETDGYVLSVGASEFRRVLKEFPECFADVLDFRTAAGHFAHKSFQDDPMI